MSSFSPGLTPKKLPTPMQLSRDKDIEIYQFLLNFQVISSQKKKKNNGTDEANGDNSCVDHAEEWTITDYGDDYQKYQMSYLASISCDDIGQGKVFQQQTGQQLPLSFQQPLEHVKIQKYLSNELCHSATAYLHSLECLLLTKYLGQVHKVQVCFDQ